MKVYSIYLNKEYLASFPNRVDAIGWAKSTSFDPYELNILEEYLYKDKNVINIPPYEKNPLTTPNTVPHDNPFKWTCKETNITKTLQ